MHCLHIIALLISAVTALTNNLNHLLRNLDSTQLDLDGIEEKWIAMRLDPIDPNEKRTYNMRYFENLKLWKPNGPIYIFLGGEVKQNAIFLANDDRLLMTQMARETNGAMFATEHRYYGKSLPNIPYHKPTEYYKYLTSFLALEDIAYLIKMLKLDPRFKMSKVVVVGGSYAGNLAAWLRVLYPQLVDAVIAASAPVLAKKDCPEFYEAVRDTFEKYGTKNCLYYIERRFREYEEMLKSANGIEMLKREFNITSDLTVLENQQSFFTTLYYNLEDIAQKGSPSDVVTKCHQYRYGSNSKLTVDNIDTPILWLLSSNIEFNELTTAASTWQYQVCNEFGYQMTTSSEKQPFVHWNPLNYTLKSCENYIDGDIGRRMDQGVFLTNQMYGGLTPRVTKVVFTHGDMDPWRSLGIKQDLGPEAPVITVEGTSHCGILRVHDEEPITMILARNHVKGLIKKWIS